MKKFRWTSKRKKKSKGNGQSRKKHARVNNLNVLKSVLKNRKEF